MTIRARGGTFMVDVKVAAELNPSGMQVRIRKGVKSKEEAIRLEAMIRAKVMETGRWSDTDHDEATRGPRKGKSLKRGEGTLRAALQLAWEDPFEGWKRQKDGQGQYRNAKAVVDFLGEHKLCGDIERDDFVRAMQHFEQECGNSSDTVCRKLQAFSRTLYFAEQQKWIRGRPQWKRPTPGQPRQFVFSPELEAQVTAYFRDVQLRPDMADLFTLGIETGVRLGEALWLEAADFDPQNRFLKVHGIDRRGTKNSDAVRVVVTSAKAVEVLKRRIGVVGVGRVKLFPEFKFRSSVSRLMQMARAEFGHEGNREFTFHATRHTCATRMAERGTELLHMMEQLGHKTPSITRRYIQLSPTARRSVIERGAAADSKPAPAAQNDLVQAMMAMLTPEQRAELLTKVLAASTG